MKLTKWIDFSKEVEVDISAEDCAAALSESLPEEREGENWCIRGISTAHLFLRSIPDARIAALTETQREAIQKALTVQANRYKEKL